MTRLARWYRRRYHCAEGRHRPALRMYPWQMKQATTLVIHTLNWCCVDCGDEWFCATSDNIREERRAGRHA
jgi:hypothetical protein